MSQTTNEVTKDGVYHTLERRYPKWMLAVANEVHGTNYTGEEKVLFANDEHYAMTSNGQVDKCVSDSHMIIETDGQKERLHFECQSQPDTSMPQRMAKYDLQVALENGHLIENMYKLTLPKAAVIYLTSTKNTPEEMEVHIITPDGLTVYKIPTIKVFSYTMEELLERRLYILIPFYVLVYKNRFVSYNEDEEALRKIQKIYEDMVKELNRLFCEQKLGQDELMDILGMSEKVVNIEAEKFDNIRRAIGDILRGELLELPSDRLIKQGALDMCTRFVKQGKVTLAEAARELKMTEEEFKSKML